LTIIDHVAETLAAGGRIEVRGFDTFALRHLQPRQSRNPKTGEPV
jgi:integration host factor subunit beta